MRKGMGIFTLGLIGLVTLAACASTQVAQLSTSLGLAAFENTGARVWILS